MVPGSPASSSQQMGGIRRTERRVGGGQLAGEMSPSCGLLSRCTSVPLKGGLGQVSGRCQVVQQRFFVQEINIQCECA